MKSGVFIFLIILTLPIEASSQNCAINSVKGTAYLKRGGAEQLISGNISLQSGDELKTVQGELVAACGDKSIVMLKENTSVIMRENTSTSESAFSFLSSNYPITVWEIKAGNVLARIYPPQEVKSNSLFTTNDTVVTAKGTEFSIKVNNGTHVSSIKGTVAGANIERTITYILPQKTAGLFKVSSDNFLFAKSISGEFNLMTRESISSIETGESAYIRTEKDTGRTTLRVPKDSPGGTVISSGDTKIIVNPGQELSLDITEKNTIEVSAGEENKNPVPGKIVGCGTRVHINPSAKAMVVANPAIRAVRIVSHTGTVKVEGSDGRIVYLEGNQSFLDQCGLPVAEAVPPVEQPASPISPE
ncbi:MAG TPA: hypothetical protein VII00_00550 [bacterium]